MKTVEAVPLIFLDIDGVLNSARFIAEHTGGQGVVIVDNAFDATAHIDPDAVSLLNELIRDTDARVILSSSWRRSFGLAKTQSSLRAKGFVHELSDETPRILGEPRHVEIRAFLSSFEPWPPFVVFDDDRNAGTDLGDHFIHVLDGLEPSHVERAREVLRAGSAVAG